MKNLIRLICLSLILLTTYATAQITIGRHGSATSVWLLSTSTWMQKR